MSVLRGKRQSRGGFKPTLGIMFLFHLSEKVRLTLERQARGEGVVGKLAVCPNQGRDEETTFVFVFCIFLVTQYSYLYYGIRRGHASPSEDSAGLSNPGPCRPR